MTKQKPAGLSAGLVGLGSTSRTGLVSKGGAVAPSAARMAPLSTQMADRQPPVSAPKLAAVTLLSSSDDLPIGGIAEVEISRCHVNPYGARQVYPPALIEKRANSIAKEGQKYEAIVCPHPTIRGDWIIIDGECRKRALLHLGRSTIRIKNDGPKTSKDLYCLSRILNKERNDGTVIDSALVWQKLLDDQVASSQDEVAEIAHVSKSVVSRTLGILKLPTYVIQYIKDSDGAERLSATAAYEILLVSKHVAGDDLTALVDKVIAGQLSTRDLEALRARFEAGTKRKPKEISRQYKIKTGESQVGFLKEWDSGKVAFEIHLEDPAQRIDLMTELKRRFGLNEA